LPRVPWSSLRQNQLDTQAESYVRAVSHEAAIGLTCPSADL